MEEIIDMSNQNGGRLLAGVALRRVKNRIYNGAAIKPCDYDQKLLGRLIISQQNHISFVNFPNLMNDKEYVLELAQTSLNPLDCYNYFYSYINPNLTKKSSFRYEFVCALFLNQNIYKAEDLEKIIGYLGLDKEMKKAKKDGKLKQQVLDRLFGLEQQPLTTKYTYGGECPKELRNYKITRNNEQTLLKNQIEGVADIFRLFDCLTAKEQKEKEDDENWFNSLRSLDEENHI